MIIDKIKSFIISIWFRIQIYLNLIKMVEKEDNYAKLSFAGKQMKLNSTEDGKFLIFLLNVKKLFSGELIANDINNCPGMEIFEMQGNTLGVEATIPIAAALETQPNLKVIIPICN